MKTFKEFVRRLQLPASSLEASKEVLVQQLSQCLITEEGKRKASKILGLKTFNDMYYKSSRSNRASHSHSSIARSSAA